MTLSQSIRPATALAALAILAASAVPAAPAPIAAGKASYNGTWSVLIVTQKGTCDRAYRYPVKIETAPSGMRAPLPSTFQARSATMAP